MRWQALRNREVVCGICSEEDDDFIPVNPNASYVVLMDPLDGTHSTSSRSIGLTSGSSNIDVNAAVGTIFSIYKRVTPVGTPAQLEDFLQPGRNQVVAGYVVYGSSTLLVVSFGKGVHGFTLEPSLGTFFLSHPNLTFPVSCILQKFSTEIRRRREKCTASTKATLFPFQKDSKITFAGAPRMR